MYNSISSILASAGMEIRKWMTSNPDVLAVIPADHRESKECVEFSSNPIIAALGVKWSPSSDCFSFTVPATTKVEKITKRALLSQLAKVFDPLGFISPVTIKAKLIFQDLWKDGIAWDDELSQNLSLKWISYQESLQQIKTIAIPRFMSMQNPIRQELHGFADASEKAYGAAVYLKSISAAGIIKVSLITSKTRVAPVKQQ